MCPSTMQIYEYSRIGSSSPQLLYVHLSYLPMVHIGPSIRGFVGIRFYTNSNLVRKV